MHPFSTPWKHQKTFRFSDVFRGYWQGALGTNGLKGSINMKGVLYYDDARELPNLKISEF